METAGRDLTRIASKFCSEEELAEIKENADPLILTLTWCAKEALYKLYGLKQLDFRHHIRVNNLNPSVSDQFTGTIINPANPCNPCYLCYPCQYFKYKNLVIVIAQENF